MRQFRLKGILVTSCLVTLLAGAGSLLWAQQAGQDSLAGKLQAAGELYEKGDYAGAKQLYLEVKEGMETAGTKAPERLRAIEAKLADIDAKLAAKTEVAEAPVGEEPAAAGGDTEEADKRFEEMRNDPNILKEMTVREEEAKVVARPTAGESDQDRFTQAQRDEEIRRQLMEQEVQAQLVEGLQLLGQYRFDDAEKKFLAAQTRVRYSNFSDEWKKRWLGIIQEHLDRLALDKTNYEAIRKGKEGTQTQIELEEHLRRMRELQERQYQRLMEQWEIFFERRQYDDALMVLHQAEVLKPTDMELAKKKDLTVRARLQLIATRSGVDRHGEVDKQLVGIVEQMTPWSEAYRYPENWKELSDRRLRATQQREERETPENRAVRQKLEETVVSFVFTDQPVKEAVEYLGTVGNVNIVLDAGKLPDPNVAINLKLTNVSLETAIKLLTEQLTLKYIIRDGLVYISSDEGVKLAAETVVYEVRDLLAPLPEFMGPAFDLGQLSSSTRGTTGGAGGGGLWGGGGAGAGGGGAGTTPEEGETPDESLTKLMDLVKQVIVPGTWEEGSGNAIQGRSGTIIVTHTPEVHRSVQQLLADLRRARAIQVMVDIRFVTVSDAFLEQIGVDLGDATTPGIVYTDKHWSVSASALTSLTPTSGSVTFGSTSSGLSLSGAFMDDVTVNFMLDAIQRSHRGTITNAPRLTMMNGQRAYVAVSTQTNYVQDITATVAEGAVGYDPTIGTVQDGVVFDVRPTVSADRRYVQLDLRPSVAVVKSIDNFLVIEPSLISPGAFIQLPTLQVSMVRCSVSVPDGGTLLVGGLNYGFEVNEDAGVPVLSKIPVFGQLFTHRATDQEKQSLVILVKPTILIQEEYEAAAQ